jgi:solute carrier family 25 2-oxodicarboxylate transporter 21
MIKTRHQLNPGQNASVSQTMRLIYQEGGFLRFYRGMTAEIVGIMPKSSGMYASYELVRRYLTEEDTIGRRMVFSLCESERARTVTSSFFAGLFSGIPESLIVTPTQVVKVRLQSKDYLGRYKNTVDCFRQIIRDEGILALTGGLVPTFYRNCVWNSIYFATMPLLKSIVPEPKEILSNPSPQNLYIADKALTLVTGFFGAIFATCFNAPFDVVKSRVQSQMRPTGGSAGEVLKYRGTFQTLFLIYREEGLAACYKGFKPKAIRMGLGGAVAMFTFEILAALLSN